MNDLGQISHELSNEPESLRHSILSSMAKLKGLDLLTGANAFQRDQSRLDAKQRAIYRMQGLKLEDDDTITNILADNITIGKGEKQSAETPPALPATGQAKKSLLPWLLAAGLTAANLGGGAWLLKNLPDSQPPSSSPDGTIGLETQ